MKKGTRWILSFILLLAAFSVYLFGCDMSCDLKDTAVGSPEECKTYCSHDRGCKIYIYFLGACSCSE
jgi:hypothetical protein